MRAALALLLTGCIDWQSLTPPFTPEGFGAGTMGGAGKQEVHVTNLNDTGAGSLREALSAGDRTIVFDVTGTIALASDLRFNGLANITLEGGGVTLRGGGLHFEGNSHDVIVKNVKVSDAPDDAFRVSEMGHRFLFDHVSAAGCGRGCLDVTQTSTDVTVQWSVLRKTDAAVATAFLGFGADRVTVHHSVISGPEGNPEVSSGTADLRNNILLGGTSVRMGARANVVGNWLDALTVESAQAFTDGNVGTTTQGNAATPFTAPEVKTTAACDAAKAVRASGHDSDDQAFLDGITLAGCP